MATAHKIYPHGDFHEVSPGLWQLTGSLPMPLPRNMTVYRMKDGTLLLHSVVAIDDARLKALDALGKPTVMVVPHPMHTMDAPFFAERYPDLRVYSLDDAKAKLAGRVAVHGGIDALAEHGITGESVPGMKCHELVLDLPLEQGGRALAFTDVFGHSKNQPGLMLRLLGPPGGTGVARIVKWRQVASKAEVRRYLEGAADKADVRIITSAHGNPLTSAPSEALRQSAERI